MPPTPRAASPTDSTLTQDLEAALVRELFLEWHQLNRTLFRGKLIVPSLELSDLAGTLGRWILDRRVLEISRRLVVSQPWTTVVEVLKHEMAHQYVHEILVELDETSHGPKFRALCDKLGIDASAAGLPVERSASATDEERILDRVAKLLALAESSNRNEAEAAMATAQKLLLKHNLEHRAQSQRRGYAHRHLGAPTGRVSESDRRLAGILLHHFFVDAIWIPVYRPLEGKRGTVLEVCGTPSNLDIAEYVHGYLTQTAERLWRDHQRAHAIRSNRDRRIYCAGVMAGFAAKLATQESASRKEGLVWVKDADLEAFFRKRHPRTTSVSYGTGRKNEAFAHGRAAGASITLNRGVSAGAVVRGRLLTS